MTTAITTNPVDWILAVPMLAVVAAALIGTWLDR